MHLLIAENFYHPVAIDELKIFLQKLDCLVLTGTKKLPNPNLYNIPHTKLFNNLLSNFNQNRGNVIYIKHYYTNMKL